MPLPTSVKLRGKKYRVFNVRRLIDKDAHGMCDTDRPCIWINVSLKGRRLLETIIHETLHACMPDLHEVAVTEAARDIAKVVWAYGFRLGFPKKKR